MLWELVQQNQIRRRAWEQEVRTASLADRVAELKRQIRDRDGVLEQLIQRLERSLGEDLDDDGSIGRR